MKLQDAIWLTADYSKIKECSPQYSLCGSVQSMLYYLLHYQLAHWCTRSVLSTDCQGWNLGFPCFCSNLEAEADLSTMKSSLPAFLGSEGDELSIREQARTVSNNEGLQRKSKIKTSILMAWKKKLKIVHSDCTEHYFWRQTSSDLRHLKWLIFFLIRFQKPVTVHVAAFSFLFPVWKKEKKTPMTIS